MQTFFNAILYATTPEFVRRSLRINIELAADLRQSARSSLLTCEDLHVVWPLPWEDFRV